jgi:hypothetical protein
MLETKRYLETANIGVNFFHGSPDLDKGNIKAGSLHPPEQLQNLIGEALSYGFDVQIIQPKTPESNTILFLSNKGFRQC